MEYNLLFIFVVSKFDLSTVTYTSVKPIVYMCGTAQRNFKT